MAREELRHAAIAFLCIRLVVAADVDGLELNFFCLPGLQPLSPNILRLTVSNEELTVHFCKVNFKLLKFTVEEGYTAICFVIQFFEMLRSKMNAMAKEPDGFDASMAERRARLSSKRRSRRSQWM
jgi:hypothetical protein